MIVNFLDQGSNGRDGPYVSVLATLKLAKYAEECGYTRAWVAEHHSPENTCGSPEVMLAAIAQHTRRIRLGSGASLLPYYNPLRLATSFRLLEYLAPGRVDLAVGRGLGGLSQDKAQRLGYAAADYGGQITRLADELAYLASGDYPSSAVAEMWVTGSSTKSAALAGDLGLPFCYAHFVAPAHVAEAASEYRAHMTSGTRRTFGLAVHAICVESESARQEMTRVLGGWRTADAGAPSTVLIGTRSEVADSLGRLVESCAAHEVFVTLTCPYFATKVRTLEVVREITMAL
jgi:luciferase family oxidoreductase group 1